MPRVGRAEYAFVELSWRASGQLSELLSRVKGWAARTDPGLILDDESEPQAAFDVLGSIEGLVARAVPLAAADIRRQVRRWVHEPWQLDAGAAPEARGK
jgi:hypothetical protein